LVTVLRILAFGLVAGALLATSRSQLDPLPAHFSASGYGRAVALGFGLVVVALFLDRRRPLFRGDARVRVLLAAGCAGFVAGALLLLPVFEPHSGLGLAGWLLLAGLALHALSGPIAETPSEERTRRRFQWNHGHVGLLFAAAGAMLAIEAVVRHTRLLTLGLPEEESLIGLTGLALVTIGAVAFGAPLVRRSAAPGVVPGLLVLVVPAALPGLMFLDGLGTDELNAYVRRFGLDLSLVGELRVTALLSALTLVLPCFVAGAALGATRDVARFAAIARGAALGALAAPFALNVQLVPHAFGELASEPDAWRMLAAAIFVAAPGAALELAKSGADASSRARAAGAALVGLALVAVVTGPRPAAWFFSPWYPAPIEPELVAWSDVGLITVEPERDGARIVTVDRRRVSPIGSEEDADARRIEFAWRLLPAELRESGAARVLFVGVVTPARAAALERLGLPVGANLHRTVPWRSGISERVDRALFGPGSPPGLAVDTRTAKRRVRDGDYDLVLVPPTYGPVHVPRSATHIPWGAAPGAGAGAWESPAGTVTVVWLDTAAPLVHRDLGARVLLAGNGARNLALGVVSGLPASHALPADAPELLPAGDARARIGPLALLRTRPALRDDGRRTALFERLRDGAVGTPHEALARGLHGFAAAQAISSPYETAAQRVELDEDVLRAFYEAAKTPPGPLLTNVWEDLGRLLVGKRWIVELLTYVEPLAHRYAPWRALDRSVVHAYQEFGEAADAAALLQVLVEDAPLDVELRLETAEWCTRAGDHGAAVTHLRQASALQPGLRRIERLLAMALMRAGDPQGPELIRRLLLDAPDPELEAFLVPGPLPPVEEGYLPDDGDDHDHDH
jgi:hypothetical protein